MSISIAFKNTKIIETLENFARSDNFMIETESQDESNQGKYFANDELFWLNILHKPESYWNTACTFTSVGFSEWVSRVPGLYYSKGSALLRKTAQSKKEYLSKWKHFTPEGKTQKVMGGIGTINLPGENGYYLGSISAINNASTGIPVLINEELWNHYKLKEGAFLNKISGKWKKMSNAWVSRFPSTADIPKGYIEVSTLEVDHSLTEPAPTIFHPFSIMEYESQGSVFYDYVYVIVDSTREAYREKIKAFFGEYGRSENRNGRYLIEPFVHEPLLDQALYTSPQDLRRNKTDADSHLNFMVNNIRKESFKGNTLPDIKVALDNYFDIDSLKRISDRIGISPSRWFSGKAITDESAALLDHAYNRNKIEELVDIMSLEYPNIFINN